MIPKVLDNSSLTRLSRTLKYPINLNNLLTSQDLQTFLFILFKVLTQNILNKEGPSVLTRLYGIFSEKMEGAERSMSYSVSDLIILIIYVYSLIGGDCFYGVEEEDRIKVTLN